MGQHANSSIQVVDLNLSLFELGRFQELPFSVASRQGEVVGTHHIENIDGRLSLSE